MHRFTCSKFLSIAPREVTWQQRKAILAYTQAHLGADSLLSLKRGSSDESKDKLFTMSAAFVLARYGMLQLLAQEVLEGLGVSATPKSLWWQASPQMIRIAKAFIAGNIRLLMAGTNCRLRRYFRRKTRWGWEIVVMCRPSTPNWS